MAKEEGKGKKKGKKGKKGKKNEVEKIGVENIRIDLERHSGVYFAGEVVRGTVRMNCNEPVECLGLHFQFTGQAKVNWSEPSTVEASEKGNKSKENEKAGKKSQVDDEASHASDDEEGEKRKKKGGKKADAGPSNDVYNGVTMFQSDRQTVLGDIHKTGVFNEGWVVSEGDMEIPYDDANPDIDFDPIPGLGVVNIPCSHKETTSNNLPLILRVMEHNWKTEEEVALAELLLDVNETPSLTDCKDIQQYPLTELVKKKKQKKKKKRDHPALIGISAKWLPHNAVFPTSQKTSNNNNEEFFGSSLLQQNDWCLVLRVHQITGVRSEVKFGQKYYVQVYKETASTALGNDGALPGPDTLQLVTLPKGSSSTPFAFTVLPTAPGSAEFGVRGGDAAQKAVVRYSVRVHIDRNSSLDPSSKKVITVIPNRPLPKPILLKPHSSFTEPQKIFGRCHNYSCLKSCFQDGMVNINFCIDRRCYAPGEIVDITGSDVEHSSKHDLKVDVILLTTFQIGIPGKTQLDHQETVLGTLKVPSMRKREMGEEVEDDEQDDSQNKKNNKSKKQADDGDDEEEENSEANLEDSTKIKRLVDGEFVVTEEAKPKSTKKKKKKSEPFTFKFAEPIRIPSTFPSFDGGVNQEPIEMEEARSSRSKKKKEMLRYPCLKWTYELQIRANMPVGEDFAACNIPILVTSVPPYTHILEEFRDAEIEDDEGSQDEAASGGDGMGLWKILDHGFNGSYFTAPTVTGPEKHGGTLVNAGNVVYTYDQIEDANHVGGRFKFQPMVNSYDGPATSIFRNENPAPINKKSTSSLLLSMVKEMRKSSDKREIFGTWIRDHPEHTHKLRPQDIGGILSRGTFNAFDQPSLVWELKAAFDTEDSSPLTCAHIVAAMNACKYRMVEIATILAPIASDWEEQMDTVLDLIEDNIGRDAVEQAHYEAA